MPNNALAKLEDLAVRWWFSVWVDPWVWIALAVVLAGLSVLGTRPITAPRNDEAGIFTHIAVRLRQTLVWTFVLAIVVVQVVVAILGSHAYGFGKLVPLMLERMTERGMYWWEIPLGSWAVAAMLTFLGRRVVASKWSALRRKLRLRQTGEELSDIRVEGGKLAPKAFLPRQHYKKDKMFFGLDGANKPVYVPDEDWKSMHMKVIGPTQTGKGVLLGVLADQSIRKGHCVIVVDPKPDKHLKDIMRQTAKECGRKFMELDLNDGSKHRWAPFAGGNPRDRRSRLLSAFGLADTGEQADFYKAGERALLDELLRNWGGDLLSLRNLIEHGKLADNMKRTLSYVNEWLSVETFSPQKGRGFSVERAMKENAVVWVRGHLADPLIIKAATIFIMEVIQEAMRLYNNGRTSHLFFPIDEVRFMVSDTLANGLATVAGFDMNCVVSYQSLLDLLALRDKQVNAKSISESINVNCKLTVCYQAANSETAEWASRLSGTIQKSVTRMETVKAGRFGAEEWEDDRMIARQEVPLISENTMLSLPPRVGVFFRPNSLAMTLFTGWVPVKHEPSEPPKEAAETIAVAPVRAETLENKPFPTQPPQSASPVREREESKSSSSSPTKKRKKQKAVSVDETTVDDTDHETERREHASVPFDDVMVNAAADHHASDVQPNVGFDDVE
jgi:hypothetical protein